MTTRHMRRQSPSHFRNSQAVVRGAVKDYESYLRSSWPHSKNLWAQHRHRWVSPYGPIPYYLPSWMAEIFSPITVRGLRSVATANVFLYHYYTIKDDDIDGSIKFDNTEILAADCILGEALRLFAHGGVVGVDFYSDLSRYMTEALLAECELQEHDHRRDAYGDQELALLGRKAALAKVSASALASISGERALLPKVESCLDDMAVGLQLLDDLRDWREDLSAGRFTYPLWLATSSAMPRSSRLLDESQFLTPRITLEVLERMESYCSRASRHFRSLGAKNIVRYLDKLIMESGRVRRRLAREDCGWRELQEEIAVILNSNGT